MVLSFLQGKNIRYIAFRQGKNGMPAATNEVSRRTPHLAELEAGAHRKAPHRPKSLRGFHLWWRKDSNLRRPESTDLQKYVGRLDSPGGVRLELARLYTEARRGQIDSGDAYRLSLILAQLVKAIEVADLAERLDALESAHDTPSTLRRAS